ncbi:class I SAM-dependent methyltransferase [Peredibacter starrii]|uniref:Class I SAM-dependent methyltransferase n=1 Tax=Peredibacter starrii TaxID=28202 RepID=A0AAX4HRE6_9BACT|nr:class I SAM-dependent methyltransferase [Peredibacter starrii]WPU65816.1 class I SAM-dependent methyltransferase [Peredibacter starrii]
MTKFDKTYWDKNYSDPMSMDGIGNAKEHTIYLESFLLIEHVDISTIVDLGFGYGHLFREMLKAFKPYRAVGIEPSPFAFKKAKPDKLRPVPSTKLELFEEDLLTWTRTKRKDNKFDLGICTSVFQYLTDKELKEVIPVLAKRVKYLYLTVPTNVELGRQISELEFKDEYAIHRSREKYQKLLKPHFTFISSRVLESKHYFDEESTSFTDLLYRF